MKVATVSDAGVVNQNVDMFPQGRHCGDQRRRASSRGQITDNDIDQHLAGQLPGQGFKQISPSGGDNQVIVMAGKFSCQCFTDTGRGACDEGNTFAHGLSALGGLSALDVLSWKEASVLLFIIF